jgi:RimJ/RimL family protein N-acetyltransferase
MPGLPAARVIDTPRLRLRPFVEGDWQPYATMCAFLGHWALRGYGMWALEQRTTGTLLGRVGYLDPPDCPGFELGWLLAREHWGHGYAREAAAAALRHAFEVLQRDRVISLIRPANQRSIAVAEAIGARHHASVDLLGGTARVYQVLR